MMREHGAARARRWAVLTTMIGATLAAACRSVETSAPSDSTSVTTTKPENDLHFMHTSDSTPPLAQTSLTFYAVRGEDREVRLWYHRRPDRPDSSEFLRFRVRSRSLFQTPDGTPIAVGDSLPITITVVDTARMIVRFEPAGLVFASTDPARLTIKYAEADDDINDDGHVDVADTALKPLLGLWLQESAGEPWVLLPTSLSLVMSDEVEADIPGFTNYAIAY